MGGCTEEARNKIFKQADNVLGKDLRVSYVADSGTIVKSWTVSDGKVTTHKDEQGAASGYYYFWSIESGYVQVPIIGIINTLRILNEYAMSIILGSSGFHHCS